MLCERSGVINIGIEGQMLMSAFVGFSVTATTRLYLGVAAGLACGMLMGAALGGLSVSSMGPNHRRNCS